MNGESGNIDYRVNALDGQDELILTSAGFGKWYSMVDGSSSWTESGLIQVKSYYDMPSVISWNGSALMTYRDGNYWVDAYEVVHLLKFLARGSYGGTLSNW